MKPIQEMVQNEFKTVSQPNKYNILSINTNHPIITRIKEHNDEHIFLPFLALTGLGL
jgi:HSP90 family molecular chaperone